MVLSLLVFGGLSCSVRVDLPAVVAVEDAGANPGDVGGIGGDDASPDVSFDQSGPEDRFWTHGSDHCEYLNVIQPQVEMIIALDRSSSMHKNGFDSATRFQTFWEVIGNQIHSHPRIQFGLEQFPSWKDCGAAACCAGPVSVPPAPNHFTDIQNEIGPGCGLGDPVCQIAGTDSPSHKALDQCRVYFADEGQQGHSAYFVLLATDRDPTCGDGSSTDTSICGLAIDEASKLGANQVQTFIVSLNSDASAAPCLAAVAASNADYFTNGAPQFEAAADQQALRDYLDTVMTAVEANLCRFTLDPAPSNPDQMVVQIKQEKVLRDQGWSFSGSDFSEIVLSGAYCKTVTTADHDNVPIVLDCPH